MGPSVVFASKSGAAAPIWILITPPFVDGGEGTRTAFPECSLELRRLSLCPRPLRPVGVANPVVQVCRRLEVLACDRRLAVRRCDAPCGRLRHRPPGGAVEHAGDARRGLPRRRARHRGPRACRTPPPRQGSGERCSSGSRRSGRRRRRRRARNARRPRDRHARAPRTPPWRGSCPRDAVPSARRS